METREDPAQDPDPSQSHVTGYTREKQDLGRDTDGRVSSGTTRV